jgi:hypothetical protein
MNVVSGDGDNPICTPDPITNGRMYKDPPDPYGGTKSELSATTLFNASKNKSNGGGSRETALQDDCNRLAFKSGRNIRIFPSAI